ncbi:MAG: BTAD domain-containing putative transcriptional regulator, partial [Acidimicrobiales bacterium]
APTPPALTPPALTPPALTPPAPTPPAPTPPAPAPTAPGAPEPTTPPTVSTTTAPRTSRPATPANPAHPPATTGTAAQRAAPDAEPVRLPSGSVVAGSFSAGVLSAVALGRLRRRHTYRYRLPRPGRDLTPVPLRPTLSHLAHPEGGDHDQETADPDAVPAGPFGDDERRQHPGRLEIGTRHGAPVVVEMTELSGVAVCGPSSHDITRAVVAGLLVRAGPIAAEVLLTAGLADRLLPALRPVPAIRRVATTDDAARAVEAEIIARTRRLDAVGASNAAGFRASNPENPLPLLVAVLDEVPDASLGRWAALVETSARLGIAVVFLGDSPAGAARLVADASRTVTAVMPAGLVDRLVGARLFGLRGDEAVELLGAVADSYDDGDPDNGDPDDRDPDDEKLTAEEPVTLVSPIDRNPPPAKPAGGPWPEQPAVGEGQERPIVVRMLGPLRITVHGEAVATGLRGRAKALFAWYLLRPEGATIDEAVEALWPDTDPGQVRRQFWRPFGDLRTRLRSSGGDALEVLENTGEHYRPHPREISCDLWQFQAALASAAQASDDATARAALRRAVEDYRGDLLCGVGYLWVEPARQDLHRRALDAHLRLAELEDHARRPDAAVATFERAIDLDRYAEEPYRRLMAHHAAHGRPDAVTATWQLLQGRLADLDVDGDDATAHLYRSLTAPDARPPAPPGASRPLRLTS